MPTKPKAFGSGKRRDTRPSAAARGYDSDWAKLSKAYRCSHPLCEQCLEEGRTTPAYDVDHVVPFRGLNDPLRLDWDNLRSLCRPCHRAKTARQGDGSE